MIYSFYFHYCHRDILQGQKKPIQARIACSCIIRSSLELCRAEVFHIPIIIPTYSTNKEDLVIYSNTDPSSRYDFSHPLPFYHDWSTA